MRKIAGIFGVAGLLLSIAAIGFAADPPDKDKKDKKEEVKDKISKLAEDIFTKADKHNHGFLNKIEFKKADSDLIAAITEMAKEGLIGKGRPSKDQPDAKSGHAVQRRLCRMTADTDHDKKVTLAEFTDYGDPALCRPPIRKYELRRRLRGDQTALETDTADLEDEDRHR